MKNLIYTVHFDIPTENLDKEEEPLELSEEATEEENKS